MVISIGSFTSAMRKKMSHSLAALVLSFAFLSISDGADAATIVEVQTNIGTFSMELFEDKAPETVAFFLANIEARAYQFNMVHEASISAIKTGRYDFDSCFAGASPRTPTSSIPVEDTGLAITTRSVAMVRNREDPNSVDGEWQVNLGNNEAQYNATNRPVVFGEVIEGFAVVDSIADLWRVSMDISPLVPTINYEGNLAVNCNIFTADNVVKFAPSIVSVDPPSDGGSPGDVSAINAFDAASGLLNISVDAGASGLLNLSLRLESSEPVVIVQVQPETVTAISEPVEGMSTFDATTNNLTIPSITINGQVAFSNVLFRLTDAEKLLFTLLSANTP